MRETERERERVCERDKERERWRERERVRERGREKERKWQIMRGEDKDGSKGITDVWENEKESDETLFD